MIVQYFPRATEIVDGIEIGMLNNNVDHMNNLRGRYVQILANELDECEITTENESLIEGAMDHLDSRVSNLFMKVKMNSEGMN